MNQATSWSATVQCYLVLGPGSVEPVVDATVFYVYIVLAIICHCQRHPSFEFAHLQEKKCDALLAAQI